VEFGREAARVCVVHEKAGEPVQPCEYVGHKRKERSCKGVLVVEPRGTGEKPCVCVCVCVW
jgi:hypothetical protein